MTNPQQTLVISTLAKSWCNVSDVGPAFSQRWNHECLACVTRGLQGSETVAIKPAKRPPRHPPGVPSDAKRLIPAGSLFSFDTGRRDSGHLSVPGELRDDFSLHQKISGSHRNPHKWSALEAGCSGRGPQSELPYGSFFFSKNLNLKNTVINFVFEGYPVVKSFEFNVPSH